MDRLVRRAARMLRSAEHGVVLTGAGISTPSGIPDFRSPAYGLWQRVDPFEVASRWGFQRDPEKFYAWVRPLAAAIADAQPNAAHQALAALEAAGCVQRVITQNVDGLHQAAGSQEVLEVHGHLREAKCAVCEARYLGGDLLRRFRDTGQVPRCACGGALRPTVVLVGEPLPPETLRQAENDVAECDVMLVAGSSLEVVPAGDWPAEVVAGGRALIIVNRTATLLDDVATVVIHGDVSDVLPAIARAAGVQVQTQRDRIRRSVHDVIDALVPKL